jgi:glycosyltransferase involved in cell wall biosynthesis
MLLALALRKPLLVRHCGNWFVQRTVAERFWKWFMERFAGGRNVMLATGGTFEPPSQRNPNIGWIFSTSLNEQELSDCSKNRTQAPSTSPKLIIVCRQEKGKGVELLIDSLPLISRTFPLATLDIVGDGAALNEFKKMAAVNGLVDRVVFHGNVSHSRVLELLQQADLFCFPTASEGFPKTVLEALACGLPVITTRVSVLPQLIGTGCGYLIDERTSDAIDNAVKACLADPDRYRAMSDQAIQTAGQYSLERWRDRIGDLLESTCGPLRSGPELRIGSAADFSLSSR